MGFGCWGLMELDSGRVGNGDGWMPIRVMWIFTQMQALTLGPALFILLIVTNITVVLKIPCHFRVSVLNEDVKILQ